MRLNEISGGDKWYRCRIRVDVNGATNIVNTRICCDSRSGLIALLSKTYGRNNILSCNEISDLLGEKIYGAPKARTLHHNTMNRRPLSANQLQIKSMEDKARTGAASGDVSGASVARAQVAVKKAQNKKNAAQQDYTKKAMKLSSIQSR
jgi:hypothetical protein